MTNLDKTGSSVPTAAMQNKGTAQFVGFQLANQQYAFPIEGIQEIVILQQFTRVPQTPSYVEGVSNLRGSIIPIISLRTLFGIEPKSIDHETRVVVVNVGLRTMGCTVDSVAQVMRIPNENIQAASGIIASKDSAYVRGFSKVEGQLIMLLDIDELMDPEKIDLVNQRARIAKPNELQESSDLASTRNDIQE